MVRNIIYRRELTEDLVPNQVDDNFASLDADLTVVEDIVQTLTEDVTTLVQEVFNSYFLSSEEIILMDGGGSWPMLPSNSTSIFEKSIVTPKKVGNIFKIRTSGSFLHSSGTQVDLAIFINSTQFNTNSATGNADEVSTLSVSAKYTTLSLDPVVIDIRARGESATSICYAGTTLAIEEVDPTLTDAWTDSYALLPGPVGPQGVQGPVGPAGPQGVAYPTGVTSISSDSTLTSESYRIHCEVPGVTITLPAAAGNEGRVKVFEATSPAVRINIASSDGILSAFDYANAALSVISIQTASPYVLMSLGNCWMSMTAAPVEALPV